LAVSSEKFREPNQSRSVRSDVESGFPDTGVLEI
jgi:hypothetical protein